MKRTDKKGFTIVELVIVIAVIAILAAVLIPNLSKMVRNAKESSDIQLIRNMNTAMQVESVGGTKRYDTAHDAITAATAAGYDLTKISLSDKENTILWDEENQCFAYLRKGETTPEYVPNSKKDNTNTPAEKLWKVETEVKENGGYPYSVYWNGGDVATINVKNVGFDAGIANIGTVNYTGDAGKTVVIRTNSYSTTLTIDAIDDSVKHYDLLGVLTIENVKGESYHEFGKVKNVTIKNGRFVAEEGSEIETIVSEAGATFDTSKCTIWNAPTYTWSSDKTTCTATRIDKKGVKTETETVTATVETVPATTEAAGKTTYTATFVNPAFAEQTEEVEIPKQLSVEETLVDSMNAAIEGYTGESIMKALVFMSDKGTNVTVANLVHGDETKTFVYDITAHRFYIVNTADGTVQYPANTTASGELVYVVNSCNTITSNMTRIYVNNMETIKRADFVVDATVLTKNQKFKSDFISVEIGAGVLRMETDRCIVFNGMVYSSGDIIEKRFDNNSKTHKLYYKDGKYYWYNRTLTQKEYEFDSEADSKYLIDPYQDCFYGCSSLKSVYIGDSVEYIGKASFAKCENIDYIYYNANAAFNVDADTAANDYAPFKSCGSKSNGMSLEIGNNVRVVPLLFGTPNDLNLTSVTFEENSICSTIEAMAFWNAKITEIILPKTITNLSGSGSSAAFYGCASLAKIGWYGTSITCGGKTFNANNQDTSDSGLTAFQNYMRGAGTHSKAPNLVIELIK